MKPSDLAFANIQIELDALHVDYDELWARYQGLLQVAQEFKDVALAEVDDLLALLARYQWHAIDGDAARVPKGQTLDFYSSSRGVRFTGEWRPEYIQDVTHWAYRQPSPSKQTGEIK